jgi:hypothetical protein
MAEFARYSRKDRFVSLFSSSYLKGRKKVDFDFNMIYEDAIVSMAGAMCGDVNLTFSVDYEQVKNYNFLNI